MHAQIAFAVKFETMKRLLWDTLPNILSLILFTPCQRKTTGIFVSVIEG